MAAYGPRRRRSELIEGPRSSGAKQALGLSLVLHELATNAAKYGALSGGHGSVVISWSAEDGGAAGTLVRFLWRERDGPTVSPPEEEGFGTQLIQRASEYDLGGEAEMNWAEDGLTCEIVFPES